MKKLMLFILVSMILGLSACSSAEGKELAEYHNNYVETVNEKATQVEVELNASFEAGTLEEELKLQEENVLPLISEIEEYIESQKPESDVVKEMHSMRLEQMRSWVEVFNLRFEALEKTIEGASEEEVAEIVQQAEEKVVETQTKAQAANEKMAELADEYNVELIDEE
ncbi:hypothetical protein QGM71_15720 [Virgibacillus sp. C22-A2]|uniref:Lipoprotein n=1 Tax=Virgibacillus tibetensis TaxID=3042313 RepID=A0ABU6KJ77_9BACI|nr:hypothetical protein [Virgibacillus sp. C22-A2]